MVRTLGPPTPDSTLSHNSAPVRRLFSKVTMQTSMLGNTRAFQASRVSTAARPARVAVPTIEARVSLRFQRFGRKKSPFYRLVAIESKDRRNGRPLEYLG